jgi:RND superfamily putative drug exporter
MAELVLQNKALVTFIWVALCALSISTLGKIGGRLDYTYTTPGQPGFEANLKITERFGIDPAFEAMLPLLDLPSGMSMLTPQGQATAAATFSAVTRAGPLAYADYATTGDPIFLLDGGKAAWALVSIPNPDYGVGRGIEGKVEPTLRAATAGGAKLTMTGFAKMLSNAGPNSASLREGLFIGAALALITLFLVYGSPIAVLPIVMAIPAILVTFFGVFLLTFVAKVSYFVEYMVVLLSLGISVDYSLILVVRWREEREKGLSNEAAVLAALTSSGRAVALSGVTAATGLLCLVLLPVPFLRSIGIGGMLIPFVAVAVATTLLPVWLAVLGPALDRFCLWPRSSTTYSTGWERWARFVLRHKWKAAIAGLAIIGITTLPAFALKTGEPLIGSLSQYGPAAEAFHRLQASGVPSGVDFPIYVMTHGGPEAVTQAVKIAKATSGVYAVIAPDNPSFRRGSDALITIIPNAEGSLAEGKATVAHLRERLAALTGGAADVGGSTAEDISFTNAVYGTFPLMLTVVSVVTMIILARSIRSVALAVKAVVLNVISLGSAFGFIVFFWQQGHGSSLVYGMPATDAIRAWIPTVVFASLFGLSMDYEVFVLARVREEYDRTGSTEQAIVSGLARTGRLVTCAAAILMVTFLSLSIDPNQIVKISSTALAVGVMMDALIVRALLVPALVSMMGRWNWWMPAALVKYLPARSAAH